MDHKNMQGLVGETFTKAFGRTPLKLRIQDILGEATELSRYRDIENLKDEAGDLLASLIQLANECGWDIAELLIKNKEKIESREAQYKTLGRKLKVAILGGAFNPVHDGHIKLAQVVLNTSKTFDEVWLMPCFNHMNGKNLAPSEDRLKMCELAAKVDGRIKVFDFEIDSELSGETYNTVVRLEETELAKKEVSFSWIIGLDNANTFASWVNYEHLERAIRFVVVGRKGVERDLNVDWYMKSPHIFIDYDEDIPEISSTKIRRACTGRDELFDSENLEHVDQEVSRYIGNSCLYSKEDQPPWT